jgi:hypothetical protein
VGDFILRDVRNVVEADAARGDPEAQRLQRILARPGIRSQRIAWRLLRSLRDRVDETWHYSHGPFLICIYAVGHWSTFMTYEGEVRWETSTGPILATVAPNTAEAVLAAARALIRNYSAAAITSLPGAA